MGDEIRDLDDVEAQAWATIYAAWSTFAHERAEGHADDGVRLLRERRLQPADKVERMGAEWAADVAAKREREKIVAWLLSESDDALPSERREGTALLEAARAIERGEHDR